MDTPDRPFVPPASRRALVPLLVPVPPGFAEVLGYRGTGRYLRLTLGPADNTLQIADGACAFDTSNWQGFLAYYKHGAVYPTLQPLRLGSSALTGQRALLLDRAAARLYVADRAALDTFFARLAHAGALPVYRFPSARPEHVPRRLNRFYLSALRRLPVVYQDKKDLTDGMLAWLDAGLAR